MNTTTTLATALYIAAAVLLVQRATAAVPSESNSVWLRQLAWALGIGALFVFVPIPASVMGVALVLAFAAMMLALSAMLIRRWGARSNLFSGRLITIFACVLGAMVLAALPLLAMLSLERP
jgi:hypothetical protein